MTNKEFWKNILMLVLWILTVTFTVEYEFIINVIGLCGFGLLMLFMLTMSVVSTIDSGFEEEESY